MNDYRWIASLAILVSFVAETASGQQASTFLEHERTTDGRASYVVSVVTGRHAEAITPGPVYLELVGSAGRTIDLISGRMEIGSTTRLERKGKNIGYPCTITLTSGTGDGWEANTVRVEYFIDQKKVGDTYTFGKNIGWLDNEGCGMAAGASCPTQTLSADPIAPACDASQRKFAIDAELQASMPVVSLERPKFDWNDSRIISFSVQGNVSNAQGKAAKLVLAFYQLKGARADSISPRVGFADMDGNEVMVEETVAIQSNSQAIVFEKLQVPWGGFNQLMSGGPHAIKVEASLYIDNVKVATSDVREFDYPPY
jgi:hypothetical protein